MKVGIVGGGFMGYVLAYKLSRTHADVAIFERDGQPGGLATYNDYDDFIWDKYYHVILPTDSSLIRFIEEIGLGDRLQWRRSFTGYYVDKAFYSIGSIKEFLQFPPLGILDKIKLGFTIFYGSKIKNWKRLEKITAKEWLIRLGGRRTFEKFWAPLLLAKLGENYDKVSAVFIWTYIKRLFEARQSPVNKEYMGYVSGGYKTIFDQLDQSLAQKNCRVHLATQVTAIVPMAEGGIELHFGKHKERFDKVVFTAPLNILEKVTGPELVAISKAEKAIEYLGVICLVLITQKPLTSYYVLNIADATIPFTGVIGMSSLVDIDETSGLHITYFPKYVTAQSSWWTKSDEEIKKRFLAGVRSMYGHIDEVGIRSVYLHKTRQVQPVQVLNYSEIIPRVQTNHPDFFVLNTTQFMSDTLNNNSVVQHVEGFMSTFAEEIKSRMGQNTG